mgnify:CR=1 FL=1
MRGIDTAAPLGFLKSPAGGFECSLEPLDSLESFGAEPGLDGGVATTL